tara:strand:- start:1565 stop:1864 length:300 start_codon:yes stop_codon:yes gene_type:complete
MEEMKISLWLIGSTVTLLGACAQPVAPPPVVENGFMTELPASVLAIAAPYQDLNAVKLQPSDGCFVYRHVGPVETTFLPLRSKSGNPICTRQPGVPVAG